MTNTEARKITFNECKVKCVAYEEDCENMLIGECRKRLEALEQQPCEDCISRAEVIKAIDEREKVDGNVCAEDIRLDICLLPSIQPKPKADVLDKIRAEIEALIEWHDCPIEYDNGNDAWYCEACNQAIKIIDKYKAESEVKPNE